MTTALITWGGWDGHQPDRVAEVFRTMLTDAGMAVTVTDSLACFDDPEALKSYDLIVPVWTMSQATRDQITHVSEAVAHGTGLAGCHGGMCDAFRDLTLWQFMTGANWVAHPGGDGVNYTVQMTDKTHELTAGIADFTVATEQYYLHVDPANHVLATTRFPIVDWYHSPNGPVDMPVAWTRKWGQGRVYYNALGHHADLIDHGLAHEMLRRGLLWAAAGKALADPAKLKPLETVGNHY